MNGKSEIIDEFRRVVAILASDAEAQLHYIRDELGEASIDELGLEYDETWRLVKNGSLTEEALSQGTALNDLLDSMSEESGLWTEESMRHSDRWSDVRQRARSLIAMM